MTQIILIIIGMAIIVILLTRKVRGTAIGICQTAIGLDAKKRESKEKILGLLQKRGDLSNSDIRNALGNLPAGRQVSDRSVIRYMGELERKGKVEQVGSTGRGVAYRLK